MNLDVLFLYFILFIFTIILLVFCGCSYYIRFMKLIYDSLFASLQKLADYYLMIGNERAYYKVKECIVILEDLHYS